MSAKVTNTNDDRFLLLLSFQASTHVHHVTSIVKDGHLAVVLNLGVEENADMMGPQMQFGAQTCQKLKADCCKMSNKLISLRVFFCQWCAYDKNSINTSDASGDGDAPLETLGCCRRQRRWWWGQCRGNRRKSVDGIWEGKSCEQFQNLYQWFIQTGLKLNLDISFKIRHHVKI